MWNRMRDFVNQRIWAPLGNIFRAKTIGDLLGVWKSAWLQKAVVAMVAIAISFWEWAARRNAPEAIALLLFVAVLGLTLRALISKAGKVDAHAAESFPPRKPGSNLWFVIPVTVAVVVLAVLSNRPVSPTRQPAPPLEAPRDAKADPALVSPQIAMAAEPPKTTMQKKGPAKPKTEAAPTVQLEKPPVATPTPATPLVGTISGGVVSINQQGGITAGQININTGYPGYGMMRRQPVSYAGEPLVFLNGGELVDGKAKGGKLNVVVSIGDVTRYNLATDSPYVQNVLEALRKQSGMRIFYNQPIGGYTLVRNGYANTIGSPLSRGSGPYGIYYLDAKHEDTARLIKNTIEKLGSKIEQFELRTLPERNGTTSPLIYEDLVKYSGIDIEIVL